MYLFYILALVLSKDKPKDFGSWEPCDRILTTFLSRLLDFQLMYV